MKMAAAMVTAAEMVSVTSATVAAAVMTAAATTTVATAMTAFRNREVCYAQRCREDNGSDSQRDP